MPVHIRPDLPEASPIIISESETHIFVAMEIARATLARVCSPNRADLCTPRLPPLPLVCRCACAGRMASKKTRRAIKAADAPRITAVDAPRLFDDARMLVDAAVSDRVAAWAKTVTLTSGDPRFDHFGEDVTEALLACTQEHIAELIRSADTQKEKELNKWAREDFLARNRARIAALKELREAFAGGPGLGGLSIYEYQVFGAQPPHLMERLREVERDLEARAEAMRLEADERKSTDPGGRPAMPAFAALARGLAQAFQNATGQAATLAWSEYRRCYEGAFFRLVEAILPTAREITETVTGRPLPASKKPMARGKFLQRSTALKTEDKTPPQKR
jgi:hypothetical protein